jgi:S1-C subfamily serine protease
MVNGETWGELPELDSVHKSRQRAQLGIVLDRQASAALITKVHADSPAARAGILPGDVVTRFDKIAIADSQQLIELIKTKRPGQSFYAEIKRNNSFFNVLVTLEKFKATND